jgi:hypothetical protein
VDIGDTCRGQTFVIFRQNIGTVFDQGLNTSQVTHFGGCVEWRLTLSINNVLRIKNGK